MRETTMNGIDISITKCHDDIIGRDEWRRGHGGDTTPFGLGIWQTS